MSERAIALGGIASITARVEFERVDRRRGASRFELCICADPENCSDRDAGPWICRALHGLPGKQGKPCGCADGEYCHKCAFMSEDGRRHRESEWRP